MFPTSIAEWRQYEQVFPALAGGLAPMDREVALKKLQALGAGADLARRRDG